MRILLVGSDELFIRSLRVGLDHLGYKCVIAEPRAAVERAASREFSAAVVDCDDGDALEALRGIRRVAPGTVAVAVARVVDAAVAVDLLRGGEGALALDYVEKPDDAPVEYIGGTTGDLLDRIENALTGHFRFIQRGGFRLDLDRREATYNDAAVPLGEREMKLFVTFMRFPHRDMLYTDLAAEALGKRLGHDEAYKVLRSPMSRLRQALRAAAGREVLTRHDMERGIRFVPIGRLPRPQSG